MIHTKEVLEIVPHDVLTDSMLDLQVPEVTSRAGVEAALRHGKRTLSAARAWLQQRRAPRAVPSPNKLASLQVSPLALCTRNLKRRDAQRRTRAEKITRDENVRKCSREHLPRRTSKRTELHPQIIREIRKERANKYSRSSSQDSVSQIHTPNVTCDAPLSSRMHHAVSAASHKSVVSHVVSSSSHADAGVQTVSDEAKSHREAGTYLCRQTLQPLTIRNALVCQPGPSVRISPAPLQLREKNMCVSEVQASGTDESTSKPDNTLVTQAANNSDKHVEKPQVLSSVIGTQTSPDLFQINEMRSTTQDLSKDTLLRMNLELGKDTTSEVRPQVILTELQSGKVSCDIATQTSLLFTLLGINQQDALRAQSEVLPVVSSPVKSTETFLEDTTDVILQVQEIKHHTMERDFPVDKMTPHSAENNFENHLKPHIELKTSEKPPPSSEELKSVGKLITEPLHIENAMEKLRTKALSVVTTAVVSVVPETSVAVQTEFRGHDAATVTSPRDFLDIEENIEIGPHGDCGVPLEIISTSSLLSTQEKVAVVASSQETLRLLSPIPEQTSTSEPSTCNASPLVVPTAILSMPSTDITALEQSTVLQQVTKVLEQATSTESMFITMEPTAVGKEASESHSPDVTYSIPAQKGDCLLPLLSLSYRMMRALKTHNAPSEHEASSTLSSLADSELSSLDTSTASSSLTMVETTMLRSEGEVVGRVNNGIDDDTTASDDSSSLPREDWSRGSGCSSGMLERSVGETKGVIPAAQRRRVLYLASRVAPSLLTSSEGELSEGQVLPRSKVTSHTR